MYRPSRETGRRAGIALIAVGVLFALVFGGVLAISPVPAGTHSLAPAAAHAPSASHAANAPALSTAVHPAASPASVALAIQTPLATYTVLPVNLIFTVSVVNSTISTTNTTLWLNISDQATHTLCVSNNLAALISNTSASTVYYGLTLDSSYFVNYSAACPNFLSDVGSMSLAVVENGLANGVATSQVKELSSFILTTPTSLLHVTPVAGQAQTYSIFANYSAQYTGRIELTVFSPSGAVVFSSNLAWNGTTVTYATWTETIPGVYPYTLTVNTAYSVTGFNTTGSINVLPPTNTYTNTTTWSNSTLIPGLSAGAAGTILLVVGLLIGMIVAMVVGRLVWGGPKTVAPAQPWSGKAAAANQCSVCGQTFATPEELAAHSKTEHGMQ